MLRSARVGTHVRWFRLVGGAVAVVAAFATACGSTDSEGGTLASTGGDASASGGATAAAGANGLGGDATLGTGGSGATEPVGEVGTLGAACSLPGALSCAGNYQKLTLVCGALGTWETNATCPGTQICDTRPGVTAGSCQDQDANCLDRSPEDIVCVDRAVHACNADNIATVLVDACEGGTCIDGACVATDPCPTEDTWVNCATDCGGRSDPGCAAAWMPCPVPPSTAWYSEAGGVLRTPEASAACSCSDTATRYVVMLVPYSVGWVRITVADPWSVLAGPQPGAPDPSGIVDPCSDLEEVRCLVYDAGTAQGNLEVYAVTNDITALPRNVRVEEIAEGETCP